MPCIAQVVGSILTALRTTCGNSSMGYQQPPIRAITMPSMMLRPVGLALGLDKGPQRGAQRGGCQGGCKQHDRQRAG